MKWMLCCLLVASACGGDAAPKDAAAVDAVSIDAAIDAATACDPGTVPGGCEEVDDDVSQCPSLDTVCAGVCNASYTCCYCDRSGDAPMWNSLDLDCPLCDFDAGAP